MSLAISLYPPATSRFFRRPLGVLLLFDKLFAFLSCFLFALITFYVIIFICSTFRF